MLDVSKSLAYHGFKKIILFNGHGSNMPLLDIAARRTTLETDAECVAMAWWGLLTVDREFLPAWREGEFPGSCSHACELETSMYQYLDGDHVRTDQIGPGNLSLNDDKSPFLWVDLLGSGPAMFVPWTSSYTKNGVMGAAHLATPEKGRIAYEEAVRQLVQFVSYFRQRPKDQRVDHHAVKPTMPMPWGQRSV